MFAGSDSAGIAVFDLSASSPETPISDHFVLREFACHDGSPVVLIHESLPVLLEAIRAHFNQPITVTNAYRTPSHNAAVGGTPDSRHMRGYAADIKIKGISPKRVAEYADELGVGGIGVYPTFTHVDVWGHNRRWKG